MKNNKAVAYLMDMGTGKTITTIALIGAMYKEKLVGRVLIVCPKSIIGVWEQEFLKFCQVSYKLMPLNDRITNKRAAVLSMDADMLLQVIVVNYESAWRLEAELTWWKPDMIVCDESSKIKNPTTTQSKAMHRLGKISKYNLILTGTPVTNNPLDFFSQYKFLDETILGGSYYLFKNRYAIFGGYQNHQIIGYSHLSELVEKVHSIAFRVKLEDAVDLPSVIDETRLVELEPKAKSIYQMLERDCFAVLSDEKEVTARNVLTQLLRLSQCTGGYIRDDMCSGDDAICISTAKLDALEDIIDTCIDEGRKVVVFARFVPEILAIDSMLTKKNIHHSLIYGDVKDRAEQVRMFQEDPDVKVFVGQLQTTGMGLTLTAANVTVYYSLDFSYANYEQSRARTHRIGQKEKCLYIHLIAKGTVDEKIMHALKHKGDVAKLMVDDWMSLINEKR